jgi:hypothetical protein
MKKYYLLYALFCSLSISSLASKKQQSKAILTDALTSLATVDVYAYHAEIATYLKRLEDTINKKEYALDTLYYYFSKTDYVHYLNTAGTLFVACKLGYFNCNYKSKRILYHIFRNDSTMIAYNKNVQSSSAVNLIDSVLLDKATIKKVKKKGVLTYYDLVYPKDNFIEQTQVIINNKLHFIHGLTYSYTQHFEHGITEKKTITVSNYSKKEPDQLKVLLSSMQNNLKNYLERQYSGYTLVQVN